VEATTIPQMNDEERAALAKQLGYTKIGKELPDDVTLQGIIKSLPNEASCPSTLACCLLPVAWRGCFPPSYPCNALPAGV
jgi:hypothetical protein